MRFCAEANHRPRRSIPFRRCSLPAHHRPKLTTTAQRAGEQADKIRQQILLSFVCRCVAVALLLACLSTTQANYDRSAGDKLRRKKKDGIFLSSFSCGLVLSERFSAQTSHLCSAPPLGCGTSRRFERLVWASLHLTERSGTIEVHLATLSAQTCTKSLTQSYMVLSIESIFVQQIKFGICGKDPLKTAVY